jgi:hypothetical protein
MHFLTVVLLPQEEDPIYDALHHLLASYYSHLEPLGAGGAHAQGVFRCADD